MSRIGIWILALGCIWVPEAIGQTLQLKGATAQRSSLAIDDVLLRYEVVQLERQVPAVQRINQVELQLGSLDFAAPVQAFTGNIEDVMVMDAAGSQSMSTLTVWRGQNARGEALNLAINEGFVLGEFTQKGQQWIVEQARNLDTSFSEDYLVLYHPEDVKKKDVACGVQPGSEPPAAAFDPKLKMEPLNTTLSTCRTIEYAIAADFTSFQRHGSLQQTANYILGIMNLVGTNYTGVFNDNFTYKINQILVYTSLASNPWAPTDEIDVQLDNFFGAAPNIFSRPFDICSYWFSTSNFGSGTVGLAYMRFTCNNRGSNAIREYGASANSMRVLVAHEIGHNLSAEHDATTGFIMSPSVNNTTTWSAQSISVVNTWMAGANAACFTACNNTVCETELLGGVSMNYDTVSNQIRVRWTQVPGEVVRIRWFNKRLNVWDSITSADMNGQFNINNACTGSREYRVEIMKRCGATAFAVNSATWVLTAAHQPDVDFGSSTAFCLGTSKQLVSRFQRAGHQYRWYRGANLLSGENGPTLTVNTGGTYRLEVNNGNGCWFSSADVPLLASDKPITRFGYTMVSPTQVQLLDSSDLATGYVWQLGNGATSTAKNPPIQTYATNGLKTISLTATGCGGQATSSQSVLIAQDNLYQNINPWGTHQGISYQGTECASAGRFTTAAASRHTLTVANQFPSQGTMEWRVFVERGYTSANPTETNLVYLAGSVFPNSVSGRFSILLNLSTQFITVRVLNGNINTNYNANIVQAGAGLNRWMIIGLSYGSQGLQVRVNDQLFTWSNTPFSLGGPATLDQQANLVATGQHFNSSVGGTVGFEGQVSAIRVSPIQRNYLLQHPVPFLQTVASGEWAAPNIWRGRGMSIPLPCDSVVINASHQLDISQQANARQLTIQSGGILRLQSAQAVLQVGIESQRNSMVSSQGNLQLNNGLLQVLGAVNLQGGSFSIAQNATLRISGNTGVAATSVPNGTHLFRAAGALTSFSLQGTLHITDPPLGATSQALHSSFPLGDNSHLRLGNGAATRTGGNPLGFGGQQFPARIGRLTLDAGSAVGNRHFTNPQPLTIHGQLQIQSGHVLQQARLEVKE